jgi:ABC-type nitrate/sulfonate/bicarbonate transport system substrate-binding protein
VIGRGPVKSLNDLRGKTVIAGPNTALPTVVLRYLLQRAGLTPGKDVKIVSVGATQARQTLILSGGGDAIIESPRTALTLLEKLPDAHILVSQDKMPNQLSDGVAVSENYLASHPDVVKRLLRALAQANAYAQSHTKELPGILAKIYELPQHGDRLASSFLASATRKLVPSSSLFDAEAQFMSAADGTTVTRDQVLAAWDTTIASQIDSEMSRGKR